MTVQWQKWQVESLSINGLYYEIILEKNIFLCSHKLDIRVGLYSFSFLNHHHLPSSGCDGCWGDYYTTKPLTLILSSFTLWCLYLSVLWDSILFILCWMYEHCAMYLAPLTWWRLVKLWASWFTGRNFKELLLQIGQTGRRTLSSR